jgi:hypothetical protein
MRKGIYERTNKVLGCKLTNSTSFGESMIFVGYIQKTIKRDLHVRRNNAVPPQNQCGKVLQDSRRLSIEGILDTDMWGWLAPHAGRPVSASGPRLSASGMLLHHLPRLHLYRSLSRFDLRAHVGSSGLYKETPTPLLEA